MVLQPDGKVLIGGDFDVVGGVTNFMARLDPVSGAPEAGFFPGSNERVFSIAVQSDDKILAGGSFGNIGGLSRSCIARLESSGRLDRTLNLSIPNNAGYIAAMAVQPDGKILIGGNFVSVLGVPRNNIARLNSDGTLDVTFNPNANVYVLSIVVQADGKILVGGYFSTIGGQQRNRIARLNAVSGLADAFDPNAITGFLPGYGVNAIAVQEDGKILVGGSFREIGFQVRNGIARLNATNGMADSFNPNANGEVSSIAIQPDGKILAGGFFSNIGGETRNNIARLDAANGLADSFNPNANLGVLAVAVQPDGNVLAGGYFTNIGGQECGRIARLNTGGTLDPVFNPNANGEVFSIAVQADGKILTGGFFNGANSIGGTNRNGIARLDAITGKADSFNPNASQVVDAITVQPDGKVLVGGSFTNNIGGQSRNFFARLSNDTAALQTLVVSQTTATWSRGGSSAQLARVTFETSTNNVNYSPLGNGTAAGSDWILTGLNFPAGQNFYIRARGYYRSGYLNSSESIAESVRNIFLPPPPPLLNIQRSANTNVVLSWATNLTGFTLESKTNINTNVWSVVSPAPVVSGTNNVVTNSVGGATQFFRLRK